MDKKIEERVKGLAMELQKTLEQNICKDPNSVHNQMTRAGKIRDEIESLGFLVTWELILNPIDPENPRITVTVWKPKKNLSPELQKIYDDWFAKRNGIKN